MYNNLNKLAVDIVSKKREAPLVHGFMTRLLHGHNELDPPDKKDLERWQRIGDYMTASAPSQLSTAKILTGPVPASELVKQIHRHKDYDTLAEDIAGTREQLAGMISSITPAQMEQLPALYFPHANSVIAQQRSPGALIHELGHGVDMSRRERESNFKRWARWKIKPLLWEEYSAWHKGRKAYQKGFAASGEHKDKKLLDEYLDNMASYNARKYPAFGTYVGSLSGSVAGGVAGGVASKLMDAPEVMRLFVLLGATAGGTLGIFGGMLAGKLWASMRSGANRKKALSQLTKLVDKGGLEQIRQNLIKARQLRDKQTKPKKTKPKNKDTK